MKSGFVRSRTRVLLCMLSFLWVASLSLSTTAAAYIYDDFSGDAIDTAKWDVTSSSELFTQHDDRLYFSAVKDAGQLVSTRTFGPGFFRMEFYDFQSTNMELPGSHKGAFAALGLAVGDNFVRIIRCQNGDTSKKQVYGVFEVNYKEQGQIQVHYINTNVTQGQLGMYYDGSKVTFYYNETHDPDNGWQHPGWITPDVPGLWSGEWDPGWTSDPKLFIRGYDLTYSTSFSADNVEYRPVPEPGVVWLLGSGLVGLAALCRRVRKNC